MTAEKLFEKLGYKRVNSQEGIKYQNKNFTIFFAPDLQSYNTNTLFIPINLHNAIHQQCKELGWLEEYQNDEN